MERLVINRTNVNPTTGAVLYDAKGDALGEGTFYLKGRPTVFEKGITFRPITTANRYFSFNAKDNKYEGETVYVYSKWSEEQKRYVTNEPIDNKGTIRLGRPDSDQLRLMSEIEQDYWRKKVRWQLCLFGIAYFAGGSYEGDLVEFNYSGKTGMDISEFLGKFKRPWYKTLFTLGTEVQGDIIKPRLTKLKWEPKVEDQVNEAVKETYRHLETINQKLEQLHRTAIDERSGVVSEKVKKPERTSNTLDSEIPF